MLVGRLGVQPSGSKSFVFSCSSQESFDWRSQNAQVATTRVQRKLVRPWRPSHVPTLFLKSPADGQRYVRSLRTIKGVLVRLLPLAPIGSSKFLKLRKPLYIMFGHRFSSYRLDDAATMCKHVHLMPNNKNNNNNKPLLLLLLLLIM